MKNSSQAVQHFHQELISSNEKKEKNLNHKHHRPRINCLFLLTYKTKITNRTNKNHCSISDLRVFCFFCTCGTENETATHMFYFSFYISDVCRGMHSYTPHSLTPLPSGKYFPTPQLKSITVVLFYLFLAEGSTKEIPTTQLEC